MSSSATLVGAQGGVRYLHALRAHWRLIVVLTVVAVGSIALAYWKVRGYA